jgi:hypothetical protein
MYRTASQFQQESARRSAGVYRPGNAKGITKPAKHLAGTIRKVLGPEEIERLAWERFGKPHDKLTIRQTRQLIQEAKLEIQEIRKGRKAERLAQPTRSSVPSKSNLLVDIPRGQRTHPPASTKDILGNEEARRVK